MEQNKLIFQIEQLRMQLCNLAKEKGISHHSVIELSQELDNYIVQSRLDSGNVHGDKFI